ncbi:MAG: hypothetical protein ACKVJR_06630 [Flavobacteriales bacterium]
MKKFTFLLLMLPNLFFANDIISDDKLEVTVVTNTKTLFINSSTQGFDFSIEIFQLSGKEKNRVTTRFNKKSNTLDLSETPTGNYIITTYSNKLYVDYLVSVSPEKVSIIDKKAIQNPVLNRLDNKISIAMVSKKSNIHVRFENFKGEVIYSDYFTSEELNNKIFNFKKRYGRITGFIKYDDKKFINEIVL